MYTWKIHWRSTDEVEDSVPPGYRYPHTAQASARKFAQLVIHSLDRDENELLEVEIVGPFGTVRHFSGTLEEFAFSLKPVKEE